MQPKLRVPFGLQGGRLYEPLQVPNGQACDCVCPGCHRPLIARQNAKTPHFAHAPGEDCAHALETAVHLAAKQIITDRRELRLPAVKYLNPYTGNTVAKTIYAERIIKLDAVTMESWLGNIRPDIVAIGARGNYLVEIAVTHFVDDAKKAKIHQHQLPAFEVDVARLKNAFTFAALTDLLYAGVYPASWLYHPSTKGFAKEAQAEHQASIAAAKAQKEADRKRREERLQQYLELPPPLKLDRNLRQLRLSQAKMQKLTVFVPWDNSFGVPRIVWQSAVLVYIAKIELEQGYGNYFPCQINANACLNWLRTVFVVTPKVEDGDSIALWKYCKHLEMLGILRYLTHKEFDLMIATSKWHEI